MVNDILAYTKQENFCKNITAVIQYKNNANKWAVVDFYDEDDFSSSGLSEDDFSEKDILNNEEFLKFIDDNIDNFNLKEIEAIYNEKYNLSEGLFQNVLNNNKNLKYILLKEDIESCLDTYINDFFLDSLERYNVEVLKLSDFNLKRAEIVCSNILADYNAQKNICDNLRNKAYHNLKLEQSCPKLSI